LFYDCRKPTTQLSRESHDRGRPPLGSFVDKLYLLPAYQNQGLGGFLVERLKDDAKLARVALRLTVLEVNPARRFYERHGFVLTHRIAPRHHMEWRGN